MARRSEAEDDAEAAVQALLKQFLGSNAILAQEDSKKNRNRKKKGADAKEPEHQQEQHHQQQHHQQHQLHQQHKKRPQKDPELAAMLFNYSAPAPAMPFVSGMTMAQKIASDNPQPLRQAPQPQQQRPPAQQQQQQQQQLARPSAPEVKAKKTTKGPKEGQWQKISVSSGGRKKVPTPAPIHPT